LLVGDGGFDDVDTMKMCKKQGIHFVFRADKDKKVKAIVDEVEKNDRNYHVVYNYVKGNKNHNVKVNLVVLKVDWLNKG